MTAEIAVIVLATAILAVEPFVTLRVILRDGHGRRPTRDDYDTRSPEP